jgi:hypothetical protein
MTKHKHGDIKHKPKIKTKFLVGPPGFEPGFTGAPALFIIRGTTPGRLQGVATILARLDYGPVLCFVFIAFKLSP